MLKELFQVRLPKLNSHEPTQYLDGCSLSINRYYKQLKACVPVAIPMDHRVKIKESETSDKYLDLDRELRKLWNMRVMVILIVIEHLEWSPKATKENWKSWKLEDELRPSRL